MEDDKQEVPTSRFDICKQDDNYSMDNKSNKFAGTNNRTSPNRKRNSPTSHAMDYTTCHIPMYMDGDNNSDLAMVDSGNPFRKQQHYLHDTTTDNRPYILHIPLEE
jgi:hypothetical protein